MCLYRNATGTGTRIERQTYHKTIEKAWTYLRAFYRSGDTEVDGTPIDLDEAVDEDQPSKVPARACECLAIIIETNGIAEHLQTQLRVS